ncbi:MAG TPA: ABC transporter permease, partial [Bacteroidales bacterium]|nr:ABC transporter permease [Bacteroidales bacterium]
MTPGIFRIILSSAKYYRKQVMYQFLIILMLAAVITGSLLTGNSVRESLRKTSSERLGNTGIVVSSGLRYFDPVLAGRFKATYDPDCTGFLELNGSIMNVTAQRELPQVHIYAVNEDFFRFNGNHTILVRKGEALINPKLAGALSLNSGDDIILHFGTISDIPADAPFAPGNEQEESLSLKVGFILNESPANFSLSISQVTPINVFISFDDLKEYLQKDLKYNRLLISRKTSDKPEDINEKLMRILSPEDIGLKSRALSAVKGIEIISDRIFFDDEMIDQLTHAVSSSKPVLTYLANRVESGISSAPYSFVAALSPDLTGIPLNDDEIIINSWLSKDIKANAGDTVRMYWYAPDSLSHLVERSKAFRIHDVVSMDGIWGDSLLMPEFPGIAGSESCSDWDAGVPIKMNAIRDKDEAYWKEYKGTPKAFISYQAGEKLWGNNYGRATAIRFPSGDKNQIISTLTGKLDPLRSGFNITDIAAESMKAADESVDFSTLFLSLGFFLILASFVLLSFAVSFYLDLRSRDFTTMFMLGFRNIHIQKVIFTETAVIATVSSMAGAFAGYFINIIIIKALNSVWQGAVQTNTLVPVFELLPVLTGFFCTLLFTLVFLFFKVNKFLKRQGMGREAIFKMPSAPAKMPVFLSLFLTAFLLVAAILIPDKQTILSFLAGISMLVTFLLFWRHNFTRKEKTRFSLS